MTRQAVLRWAWHHGPMTAVVLVVLALIGGAIAGVASGAPPPRPVPLAQVQDPEAAAAFRDDLPAVLADQRKADKDHREAWFADGYSHDLTVLMEDAAQLSGDPGALDGDAQQFGYDAQAYIDAAGNTAARPPPGWQPEYAQLRAELNQLARDEGLAPVPAPHGAISADPGKDPPIWEPPASMSNTCAPSGTTITNSSSDTGAKSHSVKTKTTCGSNSTSVTNKTSVSAKGKVTHTTTTTTSNGAGSSSSGGG